MKWTVDQIPNQNGRLAIVTGANSGIGFETARALAHKGAHVIMACRNREKGNAAQKSIESESPLGTVEVRELDLSHLSLVSSFANEFLGAHQRLDLLVANAGVMMPPEREVTPDGFELQMGTNHFGHFALVGHLLPTLSATEGSRIVVVSSGAHRFGSINFDDLMWERRPYKRMQSYGQSKLANLLFTYELQRRLQRSGADTVATAAHPGWTATNLQRDSGLFRLLNPLFAMPAEKGALPTLYAATAPEATGGDYIGPDGLMEMRGWPKKVSSNGASRDETAAERLWQISEDLTGVRYLDS